jgi:hypothetical protein
VTRHRNIRRVDHNYFHGWLVRFHRAEQVYETSFRDDGDRESALRRAIAWHDWMKPRLPPERRIKSRYVLNKTGVIGVQFTVQRSRKGTRLSYYCAMWTDAAGRTHKRSFSVAKYGKAEARARAIRVRKDVLAQMLRPEIAESRSVRLRPVRERKRGKKG